MDVNIRGRTSVTLPTNIKYILLTGNSMLGNYSYLSRFTPTNVYEVDPTNGNGYVSDGGPIVGYDVGWSQWAPDGLARESVFPYIASQAVALGKAPAIGIINMAQGGTSSLDWQPGGAYATRMENGLAALAAQGIVPHKHIHYLGCWDVVNGYSGDGVYGLTNWFLLSCQTARPNVPVILGKRLIMASLMDSYGSQRRAEVWDGMYRAAITRANAGMLISAGPDDDICVGQWQDGVHFIDSPRWWIGYNWLYGGAFLNF